jgi:hypothetical protein
MLDFVQGMKAAQQGGPRQLTVTYGELSTYDPVNHAGKFLLPLHRDELTDLPIETGYAPIGTLFTGPGFGVQFPPPLGAQALVLFADGDMILPVAAVLLFTAVEHPPFVDGKTHGWKDAKGNAIKTTDDGASGGDGLGGARVVGGGYASMIAPHVELGTGEGLGPNQGVVTKADLQAALNSDRSANQTAINALAAMVSAGSGVTPPTIGSTTATASTTVKATD